MCSPRPTRTFLSMAAARRTTTGLRCTPLPTFAITPAPRSSSPRTTTCGCLSTTSSCSTWEASTSAAPPASTCRRCSWPRTRCVHCTCFSRSGTPTKARWALTRRWCWTRAWAMHSGKCAPLRGPTTKTDHPSRPRASARTRARRTARRFARACARTHQVRRAPRATGRAWASATTRATSAKRATFGWSASAARASIRRAPIRAPAWPRIVAHSSGTFAWATTTTRPILSTRLSSTLTCR